MSDKINEDQLSEEEERALVEDACRDMGIEDDYYIDKMLNDD